MGSYMKSLTIGTALHFPKDEDNCEDHRDKMSPSQKKIFIAGLLSLFSLQMLFLSVETIIPIYLEKKHRGLDTLKAAFIMSATEYSGLIFSPVIGSILDKFGRKTIIILGYIIITVATVALALLDFVKADMTFFYLALVIRFIQGIGD
jgi:MFS family permease